MFKYFFMKKISFYIVATIILLSSCNQSKNVHYNVDPDQVLGQHYTAKDFGIWYLIDYSDAQYESLVFEALDRLPKERRKAWDNQNGLLLAVSDTADFMHALKEGEMPLSPKGSKLIPCWSPVPDSIGTVYQFNVCYGDASGKPIIDGTHVKKVSVEKSNYTGGYEVLMQFDMKTADFWQKFTAENVGIRTGMMLGSDRLLSTPRIMCEIAGGACTVFGLLSEEESYALANILNGE